jgi:hypothetical protein
MNKNLLTLLLSAAAVAAGGAESREAQDVLARFKAALPPIEQLRVYQLDWAPDLKAAKERAAREKRPIFLIVVRNSYGDMFSGHC